MHSPIRRHRLLATASTALALALAATGARAQDLTPPQVKRLQEEKPRYAQRQQAMLALRYDLADRPARGVTMSRGKPVQDGVRVRPGDGMTRDQLAALAPETIKARNLWPAGFLPLPHPHHEAGGMVVPRVLIAETRRQTGRDLTRFDLDFDLPDHLLPEFPAPRYVTTRPDLGDVSRGHLVTLGNYSTLFSDILNPKSLDGLRPLVTPLPQQQFNSTGDRRSLQPHPGVACFDCHANSHTNAATHTVGDIRPNKYRHRIDTPTLRGVNIQRLFGSQRALKSLEDFTEFEQRAAYLDGIPADATRKGANVLGRLDSAKATDGERRGQELFFGKGQCATCHMPPYYTDNLIHNLRVERSFKEVTINGRRASADGPIKTFPLRGIKDSPPYLHDDRLLTLDDTVEFFNLVVELKLTALEQRQLAAFLRVL